MNFNKEKHIERMWPHAQKLIAQIASKGISYQTEDGISKVHTGISFQADDGQGNVIFSNTEREIRISQHSFYRVSGICCVSRDIKGEKNQTEFVEVTDAMFMDIFMKPVVEVMFKADSALKTHHQIA